MNENIRVILPEKYDLVAGDTFQLFYRGVVMAPNPYVYDIVSLCEIGKCFPRYFEVCPEKEGRYTLEILIYDANRNLIGKGSTVLDVAAAKRPSKPISVLCIGDSLTNQGKWPAECLRRIADTDGTPAGLGFDNVSFVGGCRYLGAGFEAYGGWMWETYCLKSVGGMWVTCEHDKTTEDQHSVWTDENGNRWKLETIEKDRLKMIRYDDRSYPKPNGGRLVHVSNAANRDDIVINSTRNETFSPFFDPKTDSIDFKAYFRRNGIDKVDIIYILLGGNGINDVTDPAKNCCPNVIKNAKVFVDIIHEQLPDAKVVILGQVIPSQNGGMGSNYGAVRPYCDRYGIMTYMFELNLQYEAWTKEEKYRDFVQFVNLSGQFDSENGFPEIAKPVNIRSSKTEPFGINGLHPNDEGYMQIADAVFRNLVHICNEL